MFSIRPKNGSLKLQFLDDKKNEKTSMPKQKNVHLESQAMSLNVTFHDDYEKIEGKSANVPRKITIVSVGDDHSTNSVQKSKKKKKQSTKNVVEQSAKKSVHLSPKLPNQQNKLIEAEPTKNHNLNDNGQMMNFSSTENIQPFFLRYNSPVEITHIEAAQKRTFSTSNDFEKVIDEKQQTLVKTLLCSSEGIPMVDKDDKRKPHIDKINGVSTFTEKDWRTPPQVSYEMFMKRKAQGARHAYKRLFPEESKTFTDRPTLPRSHELLAPAKAIRPFVIRNNSSSEIGQNEEAQKCNSRQIPGKSKKMFENSQ